MTTKKLLTGVAFTALLAGAAHAQTVTIPAGGAGEFDGQTFASEVGGDLDGNLQLDIAFGDDLIGFGAGGVLQATITLTNATFDGVVPAAAWTNATDADCAFGAPIAGGGAGGSSVTFESTGAVQDCDSAVDSPDDGFISLPIIVTTNGSDVAVNISWTATADPGTYSNNDEDLDVADFAPAFDFDITAGTAGAGLFDASGDDLLGSGTLGSLDLAAFPAGIEVDTGVALAAATDIAVDGEFVVTFPSGVTGVDETNVDLDGTACAQGTAPNDNIFTCALAGGDLDALVGGSIDFIIDDDANALTSITAQTPTATLTIDGGANTVGGAGPTDLEEMQIDDGLDTTSLGDFDWARFGAGGTESNFRIQFADTDEANAISEVRIVVAEDGNGVAAGTYTLTAGTADTGFQVKGATVTFNSRAIGAASGLSGNADIEVVVQYDDSEVGVPGSVILRQLVNRSPGSYVATPGMGNDP